MQSCIALFVGRLLEAMSMFCLSISWMCMAVEDPILKWLILSWIILLVGEFVKELAKKKFIELDNMTTEEIQDIASEAVKQYTDINIWFVGTIIGTIIFIIATIVGKYDVYYVCALITAMTGIGRVINAIIELYKSI